MSSLYDDYPERACKHGNRMPYWLGLRKITPCQICADEQETEETQTMIPSKDENPDGLHGRYTIAKADGSPVSPEAEYFVLRLDSNGSDPAHIAACRKAAMTYADEIEAHLPQLAADLRTRYAP